LLYYILIDYTQKKAQRHSILNERFQLQANIV